VNIFARTDVVGDIPAQMVRIFVEHDVIGVPEPVAAVGNVIRSYGEVISAEEEALRVSSSQPPAMLRSEASCEVPMLPGMIQVIVHIIATGSVSNPFAVGMDVRGIGMAFLVAVVSSILGRGVLFGSMLLLRTTFRCALFLRMLLGTLFLRTPLVRMWRRRRFRTSVGNMHPAALGRPLMFIVLRQRRQRANNTNRKKSKNVLHHFQPSTIRVSECSEDLDGLRVPMVGKDVAVDQRVDRSWVVILQYNSMASFSCRFSTYSASVCAT
jgi:hypothetical protein